MPYVVGVIAIGDVIERFIHVKDHVWVVPVLIRRGNEQIWFLDLDGFVEDMWLFYEARTRKQLIWMCIFVFAQIELGKGFAKFDFLVNFSDVFVRQSDRLWFTKKRFM